MTNQAGIGEKTYKWPYKVDYDKVNHIYVDVLVVGGGLAGASAGISAARKGAKVAVADKAPIKRSGCGGAGMDHWNTLLSNPDSPMTPEENAMKGKTEGRQGHRDYIAVKGTWDALLELKKLGMPLVDDEGEFEGCATRDEKTGMLKAYDYRDFVSCKLRGGQYIKPYLFKGLKEAGAQLFERVMITNLLTEGGKQGAPVVGATGFSMETGEFFVFHTPSVILSCGYACTIWTYNMEITGNSWRWDPNEIGEGLAMAWNAGAEVVGMHKNGHTKVQHPFAWPRFGVGNPSNTWFPCTIVDNKGKEIPWEDKNGKRLETVAERNWPTADQPYCGSPISDNWKGCKLPNLISDLPERIRNGEYELPLWADLPSMPESERRSIWGMMIGNEGKTRYTIFDLYTRSGFNPDKDMLMAPIQTPEGYLTGGWFQGEPQYAKAWRSESFGMQGEPAVDWQLMTNIPGLFCAGAASGLEGSSFACSSGFYAGERAAEFAKRNPAAEVDEVQMEAERSRVYAPVRRCGDENANISWKELWSGETRVMQQCCADFMTDSILEQGLLWMDSIRNDEGKRTYARNPHELARVLEVETRMTVGEMFMQACRVKLKTDKMELSRGTYVFNRLDGSEVKTDFREPQYWLKAPYAPTYLENYEKVLAEGGAE